MESFLMEIFKNPSYNGYTVELYPHVELLYENGGTIRNENIATLKIHYTQTKKNTFTEYIHNEKCLRIYDNKEREYLHISQSICRVQHLDLPNMKNEASPDINKYGIIIVSMYEYIDPNKFPIINKYHDVRRKIVTSYEHKNITIDIIQEQPNMNHIKLSFVIPCNEQLKKKTLKYLKEVISSLS
jgi:hypothetical protein